MNIEIAYLQKASRRWLESPATTCRPGKAGLWIACVFVLLAGSLGVSQSVKPIVPAEQKERASLPHLYWHFLMYQNHLDRTAAVREQQGRDGAWLSHHFQKQLGFTDAQFAPVRSAALHLEPALQDIRTHVKTIVQDSRMRSGLSPQPRGPSLLQGSSVSAVIPRSSDAVAGIARPERAQLRELQQQHEAAIVREVANLKQALGPDLAAKLDNYLETDFARHVTVTHVHPRPHDPKNNPIRPLHKAVQP
jgi:hypothetical protein